MRAAALLGLILAATPALNLAAYSPAAMPIASATLLVNNVTNSVRLLGENNVAVSFVPTQYPDLNITKSLAIACVLANNPGPYTFSVRVDNRYNLIPVDVVDYKTYDPSYIELEISAIFLTNRINDDDSRDHVVRIDFFATQR
jgi:hypothetical protein